MTSIAKLRYVIILRSLTLCFFILSTIYPQGYYRTCTEIVPVKWIDIGSQAFYITIIYLCVAIFVSTRKYYFVFLILDTVNAFNLFSYVLMNALTGSILLGGVNFILYRFFNYIFGLTGLQNGCGNDTSFTYQWGYLFYISTMISFYLSLAVSFLFIAQKRINKKYSTEE